MRKISPLRHLANSLFGGFSGPIFPQKASKSTFQSTKADQNFCFRKVLVKNYIKSLTLFYIGIFVQERKLDTSPWTDVGKIGHKKKSWTPQSARGGTKLHTHGNWTLQVR